jgi:transcriptional regulator with XRE-family HTH domain
LTLNTDTGGLLQTPRTSRFTPTGARADLDPVRARRLDLGRFLRSRRSRVDPLSVDLISPGRRRVRGLRRDEVAAIAQIGVSWYTMLEQGHVENVSPRALSAIARALRLDVPERDHLFALAANAFGEIDFDDTPPPPELTAFIRTTTVGMAFMTSPTFDVVAYNTEAANFFDFDRHGSTPNLLRIMLANAAMRERFILPDWRTVLSRMIGHLRIWNGRIGGPDFERLIGELRSFAEFSAIWDEWDVISPPSERTLLRPPGSDAFTVSVTAFTCFKCPAYTIILKTRIAPEDLDQNAPPIAEIDRRGAPRATDERRRRTELGAFIRQRRERMRPQDIGIIPLGRRHARGLRRDEVAASAGIGLSWYTMLEQGRVNNVTERTLRAVATALKLTARERLYLERLRVQSLPEIERTEPEPNPDLLALIRSFPGVHAHFHDAHFTMLAWNAIADEFYSYSSAPQPKPNMLEIMVRNRALRDQFVGPNWSESISRMLAHYRFTHALFGESESDAMIETLARESPEFAAAWLGELNVLNPATELGRLIYPVSGPRTVTVILLTPTNLPAHTLVLKVPVEEAPRQPIAISPT